MHSKEIIIAEGATVELEGTKVKVSGGRGEIKREFKLGYGIVMKKSDNKVVISTESKERKAKALVGTIIAHIKNMMKGVNDGYAYKMKIVYSHFPMTVKVEGNKVVTQNFMGERTSRSGKIIGNAQVKIEGQDVTVSGIDLEEVGATASNIELSCRIVGYDKRRFSDGIYLVSGKKGA